ncbi:sulfite exporter TauE/SafE family protein [Carnimonas nigrificans]|uniref:sulfite exporter TauE/SafE family protein n=1 Tax=Carnimonas nigrificans TaxID=64323 RepID=UPI00046F93FE|nr:sulfite exporter TauE/SafE family protein [Carnimonas nigrificans]
MDLTSFLFYIVAGAGVGFAMGCTGVGGGSLMTPILLAVGIPAQTAIGTDLLYAAITKVSGLFSHQRRGNIDWTITRRMSLGSIPATILTLLALHYFSEGPQGYAELLTGVLGIMLVLTAILLILRGPITRLARQHDRWVTQRAPLFTLIAGAILGVCVTLSSVGAGVFGTAVLLLLYSRLKPSKVVGTDLAHAVPLTFIAGSGHMLMGNTDWVLLAGLLIGSLPAIHLGAAVAQKMPTNLLRWILTLLLLGLGLNYSIDFLFF